MMTAIVLSLLIGIVAGLRAMMAPAAVSLGAYFGLLHLQSTHLWFMGTTVAVVCFVVIALVELVTDQLPKTPSRKTPVQFGARLVSGGFCGVTIGIASGGWLAGAIAGLVGTVIGTLAGAEARAAMARAFHNDMPAAFIEDAVALGVAALAFILIH